MSMTLVGLVGSSVQSGRTRKAVELAAAAAVEANAALLLDIVDLSKDRVAILDGRSMDQYPDGTASVISRLAAGDLFIIGTPVYRGTYTGALKNVLDHLPLEALEGKVVALIATGATSHHYLSIDHELRGVLAWFNAYLLPGSVYLEHSAYAEGELKDQGKRSALAELGKSLVEVHSRLRGVVPKPACLARASMKSARPNA